MTNTRIDHTGHNHPNTTAARTACRKAIREAAASAPVVTGGMQLASVGNGTRLHYIDFGNITRCGKEQAVFVRYGSISEVDCKGCASRYGIAHS